MLYIIEYILVKNQKIKSQRELVLRRSEIYFRSSHANSHYYWGSTHEECSAGDPGGPIPSPTVFSPAWAEHAAVPKGRTRTTIVRLYQASSAVFAQAIGPARSTALVGHCVGARQGYSPARLLVSPLRTLTSVAARRRLLVLRGARAGAAVPSRPSGRWCPRFRPSWS